jgi:aminodeoxyfutalosine deaminase
MRNLTADYIFTGEKLLKDATLIMDDSRNILDIAVGDSRPGEAESYKGILCPGFVNAHCHLELSYLKGKIREGTGLDEFIRCVEALRKEDTGEILPAMEKAEDEMIRNGIVAVGDISNTAHSFDIKSRRNLSYHTFVEVLGFHPAHAASAFSKGRDLRDLYLEKVGKAVSITPHAPYSVSGELLRMISTETGILSIHNQENEDENKMFEKKEGRILKRLESFGIDVSFWQPTGKSSLRSILPLLPADRKVLLVHNTFTTGADLEWANEYFPDLWWCLCPSANLYIENTLPELRMFKDRKVAIGTDSLASNTQLSVLGELKVISAHKAGIDLETLLKWGTSGGASSLGMDDRYGYFKKGFKPGVNLIEEIDPVTPALTNGSSVRRLVA